MVNPTGDPGMATAGSGDVLTGLLAGLLAQGMAPFEAAMLGVYLHGLAGEHAAQEMTSYGLMASDILYHFPESFKFYDI
jgi:NAD(P)H-hydrate epimerase